MNDGRPGETIIVSNVRPPKFGVHGERGQLVHINDQPQRPPLAGRAEREGRMPIAAPRSAEEHSGGLPERTRQAAVAFRASPSSPFAAVPGPAWVPGPGALCPPHPTDKK